MVALLIKYRLQIRFHKTFILLVAFDILTCLIILKILFPKVVQTRMKRLEAVMRPRRSDSSLT